MIRIARITPLLDAVGPLRLEALTQNVRCVERLVADWETGTNRFERPGEMLLGVFQDENLVAVGGLNRDPYTQADRTGRLRHFYVMSAYRRFGIGGTLARQILLDAYSSFRQVRLKTDTPGAAVFYETLGFSPIEDETASHAISLLP